MPAMEKSFQMVLQSVTPTTILMQQYGLSKRRSNSNPGQGMVLGTVQDIWRSFENLSVKRGAPTRHYWSSVILTVIQLNTDHVIPYSAYGEYGHS